MNCPADGEQLVMTDRAGVEIDYCPKCRGVWLDRGELDKIIERSAAPAPRVRDDHGRDDRGRRDHGDGGYRPKRRDSLLKDLFDF